MLNDEGAGCGLINENRQAEASETAYATSCSLLHLPSLLTLATLARFWEKRREPL